VVNAKMLRVMRSAMAKIICETIVYQLFKKISAIRAKLASVS